MRLRTRLLTSAAVVGSLVVPLVPSAPAGAAPAPVSPEIQAAVDWLTTQQKEDGGFESTTLGGFETPDAILGLAAAGQASTTWDEGDALAAVEAVTTGGKDALDAVDDWVDTVQADGTATAGTKAQQAAKVIVLVTVPLGLDATDFDPSDDSPTAVDLVATIEAGAGDGSYPGLTSTGKAYAVWALAALGEDVPAGLVGALLAGQQANGGFNYMGDPAYTGFDPDITATVVTALQVAGETPFTNASARRAVTALGLRQRWNGEWAGEYDSGNPNSTAVSVLAATAICGTAASSIWRDTFEPRLAGVPYPSPITALLKRQDEATGRFTSPSDGWGVNSFATSQAIQGLAAAAGRFPYGVGQDTPCDTPPTVSANRRVVNALYVDLLVRPADAAGADFWEAQFAAGVRPALLAKRFTGTPEYRGQTVERLYRTYLGRGAWPGERQAWAPQIAAGRRLDVIAAILASDEYYDATGFGSPTDETWAAALYEDLTGRPAGPGDTDGILDLLESGLSRGQVTRRILRTPEGTSLIVLDTYRQLLRRNPGPGERAYWTGELARGMSPEQVVYHVAGSAEYRALTQA